MNTATRDPAGLFAEISVVVAAGQEAAWFEAVEQGGRHFGIAEDGGPFYIFTAFDGVSGEFFFQYLRANFFKVALGGRR